MKWRTNTLKSPRRSLRRCKRLCYTESNLRKSVTKRRARRRYRSWSPSVLRQTASPMRVRRESRPQSASSLDSVVYLGMYEKVPHMVVLDDTSDEEPPKPCKRKLRKLRSPNSSVVKENKKRNTSGANTSFLNNEMDLLNMLREMHVSNLINNGFNCPNTVGECQT